MAMFGKKSKQTDSLQDWISTSEAPRSDVMDGLPSSKFRRFTKGYTWMAFFLTPILALALFISGAQLKDAYKLATDPKSTGVSTSSTGRDAATAGMEQWLASTPAPLPGGKIVSWDGARTIPFKPLYDENGKQTNTKPAFETEIDSFTVADGNGKMYKASIQVYVDPRGGATTQSGPSLEAIAPVSQDSWTEGAPWAGLNSTSQISDSVTTAVAGWANAYTSGDPKKLTIAVGDPDSNHMYVPLSNVNSVTALIDKAALPDPKDNSKMIAQVVLNINWKGQAAPKKGEQAQGVPTTVDVLIARANTSAPLVVAWGAPGSGPTLTQYQNAVANRPLDSTVQDDTETVAPSAPASTPAAKK